MKPERKQKLHKHLEDILLRRATENEKVNAENDALLLVRILMEELDELKEILKKKNVLD